MNNETRITLSNSANAEVTSEQQLEVQFQELSYAVPTSTSKGHKLVLDQVSGRFRPGRLTVILGSSGAGKTSLLTLLAGETRKGIRSGAIRVNGTEVDGRYIRKISGFVHQEDVIMDTQKVREAIEMSAKLRLPEEIGEEERAQRVNDVIEMMHLEKAQHTIIGNSMVKGVSGGEKKRTAIAMELVTNPKILFLDEPTSGLDSYSAYTTVKHLKDLASTGRTIIATLHQPSSEIFHLIDDLVLMSNGGILYSGPAADSIAYFARLGFACPQYCNPADFFFMSVLHSGDALQLIKKWSDSQEGSLLSSSLLPAKGGAQPSRTAMASGWRQFLFLLRRAWNNAMRNRIVFRAKLMQVTFMGILIAIIFWQIPGKSGNAQIQDRAGVLFMLIVNSVLAFATGNLTVFATEKAVFQREFSARMYGLPAYFASKIIVDAPILMILPSIYVVILYFSVGLQAVWDKFFICLAAVVLLANSGAAIGLWSAATFPSMTVSLAIFPMLIMPLMMFAGLFVNLNDLPRWISWVQWCSPMKYGFVALMKNEFTGLEFGCGKGGISTGAGMPQCVPRTGQDILKQYALDDKGEIWVNLLALAAFTIILTALAYVALLKLTWKLQSRVKAVDKSVLDKMISSSRA